MTSAEGLKTLSAALLWCASAWAFAADAPRPVQTKVHGVITLHGKPLANKTIVSCEQGRTSLPEKGRTRPSCASPIRIKTDQHGEFSFQQTGGSLPAARPSPVGDPGYTYWFEVQDGNEPKWFMWFGLGWARSELDVQCEIRPPRKPGETKEQYRQRDLLECRVNEQHLFR